jgi:hypothetical protein
VSGCALAPAPSRTAEPSAAPSLETTANGPNPPPGQARRIDDVTLSDDGRTVILEFVGGKPYDPGNPCSTHYFGWAHEVDGTLEVKVVDDTPPFPGVAENIACTDEGYTKHIPIELEQPFLGFKVHDAAGYVHFVRSPPQAAVLPAAPAGWTLLEERGVEESPTGRWQQTWAAPGGGDPRTSRGRVTLYQAFGGPASVSGGQEISAVEVGGEMAVLYRQRDVGELVLVWSTGGDGFALVANDADFTPEQLIDLAERIEHAPSAGSSTSRPTSYITTPSPGSRRNVPWPRVTMRPP